MRVCECVLGAVMARTVCVAVCVGVVGRLDVCAVVGFSGPVR